MFVLPRISPKRFRVAKFLRVFDTIYLVSIAASVSVSVLGLLEALGIRMPAGMSRLPVALSLIVCGNFLGKTTKNFWLGVRTPWTLASDEVWLKTHRLAGAMFIVAGLVDLATALAGWNTPPQHAGRLARHRDRGDRLLCLLSTPGTPGSGRTRHACRGRLHIRDTDRRAARATGAKGLARWLRFEHVALDSRSPS
jgi:hypothetical protein